MNDVTLMHYGIKGQKWGVRRFENEDGTLTEEGKRRYGLSDKNGEFKIQDSAKSFYAYNEMINEPYKKMLDREKESGKNVSKHRNDLINRYKEKGLSQDDAELAALKRERIEKTIKIAGGIAIAAAAVYGTYKVHQIIKNNADVIIPSNTDIFRVTGDAGEDLNRAGFVAFEKGDIDKYKGLYAQQIKQSKEWNWRTMHDPAVFQLGAKAKGELKIAGEGKGKEIYKRLMKNDPEFRSAAEKVKFKWEMFAPNAVRGDSYKAFNQRLADHTSKEAASIQKKFYDALKKEGYAGVIDTNDRHNSGYDSKNPVILFNLSESLTKIGHKRLDSEEIKSAANKVEKDVIRSALKKTAMRNIGTLAVGGAIGAASNKVGLKNHERSVSRYVATNKTIVSEYKKQHPGTKLSDKEIIENELGLSNK